MESDPLHTQEAIEKAIRKALERNTRSSVMYLFRERLIREVIETAAPLLLDPYIQRINELEDQLAEAKGAIPPAHIPPPANRKLDNLKGALGGVIEAIDEDPLA